MIFNVLFLFLVFVATLYGVFHGEDLSEIAEILKTVNLYWLFPGVVCVIIFIWGESIIIFYMMHTLGIHLKNGNVSCFPLWDSFSAVSRHPQQEDSRRRFII